MPHLSHYLLTVALSQVPFVIQISDVPSNIHKQDPLSGQKNMEKNHGKKHGKKTFWAWRSRWRRKPRSCSPKRLRRCSAPATPAGSCFVVVVRMGPGNGERGQIHDPRTGGESCGHQGAVLRRGAAKSSNPWSILDTKQGGRRQKMESICHIGWITSQFCWNRSWMARVEDSKGKREVLDKVAQSLSSAPHWLGWVKTVLK